MRHGCDKRCPKVREQQRKAREARDEFNEDESSSSSASNDAINEVAGPSGLQKIDARSGPRSKESDRHKPGISSPRRIKTPVKSHESLRNRDNGRISPTKSHERKLPREIASPTTSKTSRRDKEPTSGQGRKSPTRSYERQLSREIASPTTSKTSRRDKEPTSGQGRKSPTRSYERQLSREIASPTTSKTSRRDKEPTSGRKSSTLGRKFVPERRGSPESRQKRHEYPDNGRKNVRNEARQPEVRKSGTSGRRKDHERPYLRSIKRDGKHDNEAGPSRKTRERQDSMEDTMSDEGTSDDHKLCERHCRGRYERIKRMKNDHEQEAYDEYLINKGLSYFRNLCNCHCACLFNQLWKDPFITSTAASAALFAIGVKLCSELDGWTISNTF